MISAIALTSTIVSINSPSASNNIPQRAIRTDHHPAAEANSIAYSKAVIENAGLHTTGDRYQPEKPEDTKLPGNPKPALVSIDNLVDSEEVTPAINPEAVTTFQPSEDVVEVSASHALPPSVMSDGASEKSNTIQIAMLSVPSTTTQSVGRSSSSPSNCRTGIAKVTNSRPSKMARQIARLNLAAVEPLFWKRK